MVNAGDMYTVYPKKYAHGFVVLCFVVVMQSFIMNSHEVFIHIHQGCFAGTGAIVRLPQCQWSKPDGYGKISQCIPQQSTAKQKPCAYFLGYTVHVAYRRIAQPDALSWVSVEQRQSMEMQLGKYDLELSNPFKHYVMIVLFVILHISNLHISKRCTAWENVDSCFSNKTN